jgi:hypothetical protein
MKKLIIVVTHLGANSSSLCHMLGNNKKIQWSQTGIVYDHPTKIKEITSIEHKFSNFVGLYINEVFYNYQICHKGIYQSCEFVYLVREPKCLEILIDKDNATYIVDYYVFRLRRIYEMIKCMRSGIFLTWQNLINQKGVRILEDKLGISEKLVFEELPNNKKTQFIPVSLLKKAEQAYELCLYRINSLGL